MERRNNQLSFLDQLTNDPGGKRTAESFRKCDKYIPLNELAEPLKDMYANNTNKGGASNRPVVTIVKCMMLQRWFNLSDPMLEEKLFAFHCLAHVPPETQYAIRIHFAQNTKQADSRP